MNITALFYDHSSYKSILTFDEEIQGGPDNIISLCKEKDIKECYFISKNFHTFVTAWKSAKKAGIQLKFGLELIICEDVNNKSEDSLKTNSKIIVWMKNSDSYKDLITVYSKCFADPNNKYYNYRLDYKQLKEVWTENLILSLPFFDSFIANNLLVYGSNILPDFPTKPVILREYNSGVPFAPLLDEAINNYNRNKDHEEVQVKTIYYNKREDAAAWQVYRAIHLRSTYNKPEMPYCCSDNFSFEDYCEVVR